MKTSIIAMYRQEDQIHIIEKYPNGKYHNKYGYDKYTDQWLCYAGEYETLEESEKYLMKHRPGSEKLNRMCRDCKAVCKGTTETVWTGCIYKQTA